MSSSHKEQLHQQLTLMYGKSFSHLTCLTCMQNALDDDYAGQITDDEELDKLHQQRRTKRRERQWMQQCHARRKTKI